MVFRCKGICDTVRAEKTPNGMRYRSGQKYCTNCGVFVATPEARCPCCNGVLRTGPKSRRNRLIHCRI